MWTKDDYQEHMLGYLDGVQTAVETLERSHIGRSDLVELYENLDTSLERLWRLIKARDTDWEQFLFTLEASCDELLRAFYRVPRSSGRLTVAEFIEIHEGKCKSFIMEVER